MFDIALEGEGSIRLKGRLDAVASDAAEKALMDVNCSSVMDCTELEYISSAGLVVILRLYKRLHDKGMSLRLVGLSAHVRNVLCYAGLERLFLFE